MPWAVLLAMILPMLQMFLDMLMKAKSVSNLPPKVKDQLARAVMTCSQCAHHGNRLAVGFAPPEPDQPETPPA